MGIRFYICLYYMQSLPESYMHRCIELASLGAGYTAPNPMVGAVLVYGDRIIGEGYHAVYGGPHAEVVCIGSVKAADQPLIARSTLYVSLEPCAHFGKTPPCADLIIDKGIPRVVIGCRDPFVQVNGRGIDKLKAAGVEVTEGLLETACRELNKRFFCFQSEKRPYIILKWAQSLNGCTAKGDYSRVQISNPFSNRLVHRWRAQEASILVGTNTALLDDPALSVRQWSGPNPIRLVLDLGLRLPHSLQVFDRRIKTIVFNRQLHREEDNLVHYRLPTNTPLLESLMAALYELKIQSVLVEGGTKLHQTFLNGALWDEVRVIENDQLLLEDGIKAPVISAGSLQGKDRLQSDQIYYFKKS